MLKDKTILLIISGGIAAYKSLELIRLLKKDGASVRCILTAAGEKFVTPLSVSALSQNKVYNDLWSLTDEAEMGHIRLSRESDLVVVAPASADILAKMVHGLAGDLATTALLATNKPVMVAPAMNPEMWSNPATQHNISTLTQRGVFVISPESGEMACGETGIGRMSEAAAIHQTIHSFFLSRSLKRRKVIVTAGPTLEPIDPVRFLGNRSSGRQGYAIAEALRDLGADVTLISGEVSLPSPTGIKTIRITTALEMLSACETTLPADIAIFSAAVSDWRPKAIHSSKIKKSGSSAPPDIHLVENPDILATISNHKKRPALVIGFAAETQDLQENAARKLKTKNCDWIIGNLVGADENGHEKTFGSSKNQIYLLTKDKTEEWPRMSKKEIAVRLALRIAESFKTDDD